ncbi:hypothetical protein MN202_15755 [Rheinheimera muenzenbergensis]|uniref:Uncharacterized protein n=1 Tax=Rheinheimera muenzenbergensis TaxID=1193628 RepID=A0ABU8CB00_9GAMM
MTRQSGAVLLISLILLMVMSLLLTAMLTVTQLSHKSALAAQQQLQLSQQALQQHLAALPVAGQAIPVQLLAQCPGAYAGWSEGVLQCAVIRHESQQFSANRQAFIEYSSLLLLQNLAEE